MPSKLYVDPMRFVADEPLAERAELPASAYTSDAFFAQEREKIFRDSWLFACYARDVSQPGDVLPVDIGDEPVIVLRDRQGEVRAFHNVCSHRGSKLVCERMANRKTLVCSYHAWIYGLDGALTRSQHFAGVGRSELPDLPPETLGLKQVAVGKWLDFVFVNLGAPTETFAEYIEPLASRWSGYDLSELQHGASLRYDFKANWKLVVENFLESYHVPFIHQTLNTYSPFTERYQIRLSEQLLGIGQGLYEPAQSDDNKLPRWPVSSGGESLKAEYFSIFPSFLIGIMPDHLFAWHLDPLTADRTIEYLEFYFVGDAAMEPRFEPHRQATLKDWKLVNDEDWDIIQRMHAGYGSSAFSRAVLSRHMERNISNFQRLVSTRIGA